MVFKSANVQGLVPVAPVKSGRAGEIADKYPTQDKSCP